jgi:hypothetical protein
LLVIIVSFRLSAIDRAGLEEGLLAASLMWLIADPSYLVSFALILECY